MHPVVAQMISWEFLLVFGIGALLFGSTQLSKFARSLGSVKSEFDKGLSFEHRHPRTDSEVPALVVSNED